MSFTFTNNTGTGTFKLINNTNTGFISLSNNTHGWSLIKDKIPDKIKKFLISEYKDKNLFKLVKIFPIL